eukprot:08221.XXX_505679_504487_1 [CDS] Oithona nana genome sequencing.
MTKSFFAFLFILKISLSLQSNEDWSFEEDSKGGWSTEVSNEAEMLFNGRIYGGREAAPNTWPFIVSLQLKYPSGEIKHDCAGSIINEWTVISAAHCFPYIPQKTLDKWSVLPGTHDSTLPTDYNGPLHKIQLLYVPKTWNGSKLFHDIAILVMDKPFKFNNKIQPIKMMDFDESSQLKVGKKCKIAGWGEWDDDGPNEYPQYLQEVEVPIVDLDKCVSNYNDQNQQLVPTDFNFCAGGKQGIDSCFGDSGGPIMCNGKLAGVVSFGPEGECGIEHLPGVYTNISIFAPVIDQTFRTKIQRQLKKQ